MKTPILVCCGLAAALFVPATNALAQDRAPMPPERDMPMPMPSPGMMPPTSGMPGMMSPGMMMPPAPAVAMTVDGNFLFILRGEMLVKLDKNTLAVIASTMLPPMPMMDNMMPPMTGGMKPPMTGGGMRPPTMLPPDTANPF